MTYTILLAAIIQVAAPSPVEKAIAEEIASHPLATASDIYKLLHQSVFGPGHIIQSADSAREYLQKEMKSLGPTIQGEKLHDELGDGMVRVNLRPYRDSKKPMDALLRAMIETANSNTGAPRHMADKLDKACKFLMKQQKNSLAKELRELGEKLAAQGYPASHHSEVYRNAYQPAYRIVDTRYLK
ncbi:MAG: hypothetical protein LBC63_09135 [Holophagales bacterium]|jgi:hypothetical protein|nr:hypothetical protein [Holophagales bacterium]